MLLAKELGACRLLAKNYSLFLIGQISREYQAKDPQLASYLRYVQIFRETFSIFDLVHVPKEQNSRANLLSKLASSGKGGRHRFVMQETLKTPRVTVRDQLEENNLEIMQIASTDTWMTSYA